MLNDIFKGHNSLNFVKMLCGTYNILFLLTVVYLLKVGRIFFYSHDECSKNKFIFEVEAIQTNFYIVTASRNRREAVVWNLKWPNSKN